MTELLARAEHARVGPVENCPQFGEAVLDRCAGEGDALTAASRRTARADRVAGFLTNCASSRTTVDQAIPARTSMSRVSRP